MRFKLEKPVKESDYGKTRTISKFLWLPKEINYEIRCLERTLIEQVVDMRIKYDKDYKMNSWFEYYWNDSKWVDPPPNLK